MPEIQLPYGHTTIRGELPPGWEVVEISPSHTPGANDALAVAAAALDTPVGGFHWEDFRGVRSAAIAINDKTRPAPHAHLLPPLLERLEGLGLALSQIQFIIATGAHPPMLPAEFGRVLPPDICAGCPVTSHNAEDQADLIYLGATTRGTPVWANHMFMQAELRIAVGNIEPHQFQGYSGGVKSAAIGLAGKTTIEANHTWMMDPLAQLGEYDRNPARQDVEEIGERMGVHLALNSVLNDQKELYAAFAGEPRAVMQAGIPTARQLCQAPAAALFDLVIASPGGHPKDINLYQAQKGLAHAALITRTGGTIILAAACPEGTGSQSFEAWMEGMTSFEQVLQRFKREGFKLGPHKAFQIVRDAARVKTFLISELPPERVQHWLLTPAASLQASLDAIIPMLPAAARIGLMPRANLTIPALESQPDKSADR
jgi:lactate racemase